MSRQLLFCDPVHRVNIMEFVRYCMQKMMEAAGGQAEFQQDWLVNVDKEVVEGFAKLKIM